MKSSLSGAGFEALLWRVQAQFWQIAVLEPPKSIFLNDPRLVDTSTIDAKFKAQL
jgi:hypothetical protein